MTALTTPVATAPPARPTLAPVPLGRLVAVELRKMFDTRAGAWLMASIVLLSVTASVLVVLVAPDSAMTYGSFAQAIGFPLAIVLPLVAILSVTSEWSQRSALTTFSLVPRRGRVVLAKGLCALGVGAASMALDFGIAALATLVGSAVTGTDPVWGVTLEQHLMIVLANVIGVAMGFVIGLVTHSSPVAVVTYFLYTFLLPTVGSLLATYQQWFADVRDWVDFQWTTSGLFEGGFTATDWAQLGVTAMVWVVLPLALGAWLTLRSEVT